MNLYLPPPIEFAEQMFMFYADRVMRNDFRNEEEKEYCTMSRNLYYAMLENHYPFLDLINDWGLFDTIKFIYPLNPAV